MTVPPRVTIVSACRMLRTGPVGDTLTTCCAAPTGAASPGVVTAPRLNRSAAALGRSNLGVCMFLSSRSRLPERDYDCQHTQPECSQCQPRTGIRPGYRREVEQLLHAYERRLVCHPRDLDYRVVEVDVVAVVVFPAPEIEQSGDRKDCEPADPGEQQLSAAHTGGDQSEQYQCANDPRHVPQLGNRRRRDVLHADVVIQTIDVVEIRRHGPADIADPDPHAQPLRVLWRDQLYAPQWKDEESCKSERRNRREHTGEA